MAKEDIIRINGFLKNKLDWNFILTTANRNGVLALVSWNLLKIFANSLDSEIKEQLTTFLQKLTKNNLLMTKQLIDVVNLLENKGIIVLPFKGATLAKQAYGNLVLRQYCDLDILVKPKDFDQAVIFLTENGYSPLGEANWLKRKFLFFTHKKDIILFSPANNIQIELHWKLSGSHFSMPLEISQLWNRLEIMNLGGSMLKVLPFNELFIYLCLHGSRHEWERLAWVCDLQELIKFRENSGKKINWKEIRQQARGYGCERVVELGLFLIQFFFGVKTNYPDYEKIANNQAYLQIAEQVQKRIFSTTFVPSLKKDKYMYLLTLKEKRTHRLKLYLVYLTYYLKLLFTPNSLDKSIFYLPALLYPIYFILRPIRLLLNYFNLCSSRKETSKSK